MKLVAFGNTPVAIIAVGNVATGVIAIGGALASGFIAIGTNSVGVIAIGLNAVGPLAISAINSIGIVAFAGVNALGGAGRGLVNDGTSFAIGVVLAVACVIGGFFLGRWRSPRTSEPAIEPTTKLDTLYTLEAGEHAVAGTLRAPRTLEDGDSSILVDDAKPEWFDTRGVFRVRLVDSFEPDEAGYREAPERLRRVSIVDAAFPRKQPWIKTPGDCAWAIGRAMQIGSVIALAIAYYL